MKKHISKKIESEAISQKAMFAPIVFATDEEAREAGFVPDPAVTEEDIAGCEPVILDDEND